MVRVLIAEDEMIERAALCKRIKKNFGDLVETIQAGNGLEALERFKEQRPEIIIMDIGMPGMNGVEAAEEIRKLDRRAVIIFLTAFDEFSYAKRAISIGAMEYILKPCDERGLLPVMEEALRRADVNRREITEGGYGKNPVPEILEERSGEKASSGAGGEPVFGAEVREADIRGVADRIRNYVLGHYMEEISMQDAAKAMNYADSYFCRLFKQCFDQNFTTYLTGVRVRKAKELLADKSISVRDVSVCVGYADPRYFARVFKRMTGMLPSEYRDGEMNGNNAQKMKR